VIARPDPTPTAVWAAPLRDRSVTRVCVVRLRVGLGDLLCSAPALRALKEQRPDVRVTVVTWPEMAPLVERIGHVDDLLPFPGHPGIPDRPHDPAPQPAGWPGFVSAARRRGFDLAVQCYGDRPAANDVTAALGARRVGGFAPRGWRPPRTDRHLHLPYPDHVHEVERHLAVFEHLGLSRAPGDATMWFPVTAAEEEQHRRLLTHHGLKPAGYAVLHPGASSPTRRWPLSSYAEVARGLRAGGLRIVLTGHASERPLVRRLAAACGVPTLDLSGHTDLGALALALRDSAVVVGNDTGTAHLAAAVGARSVTVFQPGDPRRWAHHGPRARALTADVACAPCPHLRCPIDFRCSRAVTPTMVLRAIDDLLDGRWGDVA
jgi:ADP-heptose:LPS heptosyltransferase